MKSFFMKLAIAFLFMCPAANLSAHMQPVEKDGLYYYSAQDTHQHIDLYRALKICCTKIISPYQWITFITSLFYPSKDIELDAHKWLNPTCMVPQEYSLEPKVIWIGHATFLIQINGFNILTDPIFGDVKVGPFTLTKRTIAPGIKLEDLPPIDAIVISHNHSDHTDTPSLTYLAQTYDPVVYVPKGNKPLVESMGFTRVLEKSWWETGYLQKDNQTLTITCLPAYHWSIRFSLGSYRQALWSSWMIGTNNRHIYFAGDTAYGPHFKEIGETFPAIDCALMPISPTCEGENKHKLYHMDALEAVDAFLDLNAHCFVPMHYGTFFLGKETLVYPIERLKNYWQEKAAALHNKQLLFAQCGCEYVL